MIQSAAHTIIFQTAVEFWEVEAHAAVIRVKKAIKVEVIGGIGSSSAKISKIHVEPESPFNKGATVVLCLQWRRRGRLVRLWRCGLHHVLD